MKNLSILIPQIFHTNYKFCIGGLGVYGATRSAARMSRRVADVKFFAFYNLDLTQYDVDQIVATKYQLMEEKMKREEDERLEQLQKQE